mmetsp:Transcript_103352/g.287746  ORF Transcript_103352/g.287746 Transcript_103352/m.287746 type:complete len:323 (-) Transcript_103352:124-1092(-)
MALPSCAALHAACLLGVAAGTCTQGGGGGQRTAQHGEPDETPLIQLRWAARLGTCPDKPPQCGEGNPSICMFWDPTCATKGGIGCKADGATQNCRYCGTGGDLVPCPPPGPTPAPVPEPVNCGLPDVSTACPGANPEHCVYWDPDCGNGNATSGGEGCNAGGITTNCRYCGVPGASDSCPEFPETQCSLTVTVYGCPDRTTSCNWNTERVQIDSYKAPAAGYKVDAGCTSTEDESRSVRSAWPPYDPPTFCLAAGDGILPEGVVSWYDEADCGGAKVANMTVFTDGYAWHIECLDANGKEEYDGSGGYNKSNTFCIASCQCQ